MGYKKEGQSQQFLYKRGSPLRFNQSIAPSKAREFARFWNTVRYLKPSQIKWQAWNLLRRINERPPRVNLNEIQRFEGCRWTREANFLKPGPQVNTASRIKTGNFTFLNREEQRGWPAVVWDHPGDALLWQYNLHYFEWVWALSFDDARTAVSDWIDSYNLKKGHAGWDPYPTSLRLMNLCGVFFGRDREETVGDQEFLGKLWRSISLQAEWLRTHVERHLMGNHLFENGAALAFVGSCFKGRCGLRWLEEGVKILEEEISEQILSDGMHFELSPMYHLRVTYLLRLLKDTGNERLENLVEEPLQRAESALALVCHSDGDIALFNDSAFKIYNEPSDLLDFEQAAPLGTWALPEAGYYGYRGRDGTYLICDAGAIGPNHIPGHAHGDMFSFELSLKGSRVIVDSGTYGYATDDLRRFVRSTSAHNTVEVEGQDQSEFWKSFRVARRATPHDIQWRPGADGFSLSAWHDGYRRLASKSRHQRTVKWHRGRGLEVYDHVVSQREVSVASRLHLHPSCRVSLLDGHSALVDYPEGKCRIAFEGQGELTEEPSLYCPEFGLMEENTVLVFRARGSDTNIAFTISSV